MGNKPNKNAVFFLDSGDLDGIFSTLVPGITAKSLLKRLLHALSLQHANELNLIEVLQKKV